MLVLALLVMCAAAIFWLRRAVHLHKYEPKTFSRVDRRLSAVDCELSARGI